MKSKIVTFTFDDLSISYGPSVHYMELWNEFTDIYRNEFEITGYSPKWQYEENPIINPKFKMCRISVPKLKYLRHFYTDIAFAFKIIKHRKDIIYIRLSAYSFFMIIVMILLGIRPIVELNGIIARDTSQLKKSFLNKLISIRQEQLLIRQAAGCIAVSEEIQKEAIQTGCANTCLIKNCVSGKYFSIVQKTAFTGNIVFAGTFTHRDGASDIIKLACNFPDITFHLIGNGLTQKELAQKSPQNVIFYGNLKYQDLVNYYSQFDAGIVLYTGDLNHIGLSSLKTLEYIACGMPVFSTKVPGQYFISEHNIGITSETKNIFISFHTFLEKIDELKKNVELYRKKYESAITWDVAARSTKKFIEESYKTL